MKIAISGCGGFIGSYAIGYFLQKGYQIRGLDNYSKGHCDSLFQYINNPNFQFIYGSVSKQKDCDRLLDDCDAVIHLAGLVGFPICDRHEGDAEVVNHIGTQNMIAARDKISTNIPFVFTSTGSVYGAVQGICTETTICNTNTVYGLTKRRAEKVLEHSKNTIIYRMATAYGISPTMRVALLVNDFAYKAVVERRLDVYEADFRRTFIHISDFVRSLEFAITNCHALEQDKIYNCGDDNLNWTKRRLAEYFKEKTGCKVTYDGSGSDLDCRDYECSYKKLNNKGFFTKKTMEEGIDELIKAVPLLRIGNRYEPN